jgi:hypothetical protein
MGDVVTITREFHTPSGSSATLTILTSRLPKLYGPGPEVPFLGTGYTVEKEPDRGDGVGSLVADRGDERWRVVYAYGEDRGLLGNGPLPWALAVVDGIFNRPNQYYKLYLTARVDDLGEDGDAKFFQLARSVFPRIASWYAGDSESHPG